MDAKDLHRHKDHALILQHYGEREEPSEVMLVCEDCNETLYSRDASDNDPADMKETSNGVSFEELAEHVKACQDILTYASVRKGAEIRCATCGVPLCWAE
jgi:hypothetical protein